MTLQQTMIILQKDLFCNVCGKLGCYAKGKCKKCYKKECRQRPEAKLKTKEYSLRPEIKLKRKEYLEEYNQRPEVKARIKEYFKLPEVKVKQRERQQTPESKKYYKEYSQKPEVKAKKREYSQRLEAKARRKELQQSLKYKVYNKEYYQRPEVKERVKERNWNRNLEYKLKKRKYNNQLEVKVRRNKQYNIRYKTDILFNLKCKIRARFKKFLKTKQIIKRNTTMQIIGCTPQELRDHIEKQFTSDMSWESVFNGEIHIDHIVPLSSAKTEEDVYRLCYYSNLQPLLVNDNLSKGIMMPENWKEYKKI